MLKNKVHNKELTLDSWDQGAITEGMFQLNEWKNIRSQVDNNLVDLTPNFLINHTNKSSRSKRKNLQEFLTRHGIHKDKSYFQTRYREKIAKEQMKLRGWAVTKQSEKNYLTLGLKKTDNNNQKYIYSLLHFTPVDTKLKKEDTSWFTLLKLYLLLWA